jgi:hypothetical protein
MIHMKTLSEEIVRCYCNLHQSARQRARRFDAFVAIFNQFIMCLGYARNCAPRGFLIIVWQTSYIVQRALPS